MIPIALIQERDAEGAFNGIMKLREMLHRKMPTAQAFEFLMNATLSNKFKKVPSRSLFNETILRPWVDIKICGKCRMHEVDEVSALTLMQVLLFLSSMCVHSMFFIVIRP